LARSERPGRLSVSCRSIESDDERTKHFTEWRPDNTSASFKGLKGAAIDDLILCAMNMPRLIRFHIPKMALLQALAGLFGAFAIPLLLGMDVPLGTQLIVAFVAACLFAGVSVVFSTHLLACRTDGDRIENVFPALGSGSVRLDRARRSRLPDLFFVRIVDADGGASARVPRPFWAESPGEVTQILSRVRPYDTSA
jgi:hypothetical protein